MIKLSERYGKDLLRLVVNKVSSLYWQQEHPTIHIYGDSLPTDAEIRRWELLRDEIRNQLKLDDK